MKRLLLFFGILLGSFTASGQTYTFTNAGSTGHQGPTQTEVDAEYASTPLASQVTANGGIQEWIVPISGMYIIEASGAQGGGVGGGHGATLEGEFSLMAGDTIQILVGQMGESFSSDRNMGGGGGSFVVNKTTGNIILIAGGGGAAQSSYATTDAVATQNAQDGEVGAGTVQGLGGTAGDGGGGANCRGGGGGGFLTDGAVGGCGSAAGNGGLAFVNGGLGGDITSTGALGGFGGGGSSEGTNSAWTYCGGGGGYSGGGGASDGTLTARSGGGGSYNSGSNPNSIVGVHTGHGQVSITVLSSGANNDAGVISIDTPTTYCPGTHNVVATIQNFGVNVISSVTVNWSVDGVTQTPFGFTGTLDTMGGTGSISAQITLGSFAFTNNPHDIDVWTSMPNGVVDTVTDNDSASETLQSGLPAPGGLAASNITSTSVDLSWNSVGGAGNYTVIYGPAGFNPATSGSTQNSASTSVNVPGLTPNTGYEAYIYSDCGGGTGISDTAGPVAFKTLCSNLNPITLPFTEDFESYSTQSSTVSIAADDTNFACTNTYIWNYDRSNSNGALHWTWDSHGGNQSAGLSVVSSGTVASNYVTLTLDLSNYTSFSGNIVLSFWFRENSDEVNADDKVWVRGTNTDPWIEIMDWNSETDGNNWTFGEFLIDTILTNAGQSISATTQMRWGQADNSIWTGGDGFAFDDVSVEAVTCFPATSMTVISVTDSSGLVSFGDSSIYELEWGPTGFVPGTGFVTSGTDSILLTNLTVNPNTTYDVYVRKNCTAAGNGYSSVRGPFNFTTACAPFTASYYNGFETDALDLPPSCWEAYATNTGAFVEVEDFTGTAAPFSGSQALYLYSSGSGATDTLMAISPQFSDLPAGDKRVRFMANSDGSLSQLIVGTTSSPVPGEAYTPLDTIVFQTPDTYEEVIVNFDLANGYNGTDEYIVLAHSLGATFQYVRIDELNYEVIPACVGPSSSSLGVSAVTSSTAHVFWGATGQGDSTRVEWGAPGFIPGLGTSVMVPGTDTGYVITGLAPQTTYEFYIQDSCNVGGNGIYLGPFSFTTACAALPAPHMESFDNTSIPACWSTYSSTGENWLFGTNTYAPSTDHTGNSGVYANVDDSESPSSPDVTLESPFFDVSTLTNPELTFFLASTDATVELRVDVWDGSTWNTGVFTHAAATVSTWDSIVINLAPFAGSGEVAFRFVVDEQNGTFQNDIAIDDVTIASGPSCPNPGNVSVSGLVDTSATLSWYDSPSATSYEVWFGPQGFYQGATTTGGTRVIVTNDSLTIDTLLEQTCYEFLVRNICTPGDTSTWGGPVDFCTLCSDQLAGTYTIGGPAGPMNFLTLDAAVTELNNCGVSGPVTFNISGAHSATGSVVLGPIIGASSVNTVTFDGGSPSTTTITKTAGTEAVFDFVGAKHVTLKNMTISDNSTTSSYGVRFMEDSDSNTVENNVIAMSTTATSATTAGVVVTNSTTSASSAGADVDYLTVRNNEIQGSYYGFSAYGVSSASKRNNITVEGNTFTDQYYYGIRVYYYDTVRIVDNTINKPRNTLSYGIYHYYNDNSTITGNYVKAITYCLYSPAVNNVDANGQTLIANNMFVNDGSTTNSAVYFTTSSRNYDFYHNTIYSTGYALQDFASSNYDVRNNIFVSGNLTINYSVAPGASDLVDYNVYHRTTSGTLAEFSAAYADLAAMQSGQPGHNANSLQGDPVFVDPLNDLHVLGGIPNNVGVPLASITTDIDGDPRSVTTPDIGADEYTPLAGDLELISGDFIKGLCLSANDSIVLNVYNLIGPAVDFSLDPLTVNYDVTGPANTSGSVVVSTGTLASLDTLNVLIGGIDLSVPGTYTLTAYIDTNATNGLASNDTLDPSVELEVRPEFSVAPQSVTVGTALDSVELCVESAFFSGGSDFFITEVMHFNTGTGTPPGGFPSWYNTTVGEHIEITGVPNSDLAGITFEQWNTSGTTPTGSYTFPPGTLLSPDGTAVIAMRTVTPSPSDYYYDGSGGNTVDWQSGGGQGVILKDASGSIIDAVGYPSTAGTYAFPAAAGVTTADWGGGTIGSASSTTGVRLIGSDENDATNWVVVSSVEPQDPNTVNNGVAVPSPQAQAGLTWTLNGVQVDTAACFYAGPFTGPGSYTYVASYTNACGTFTDSAVVIVPNCPAPSGVSGTVLSTSSVEVTWDSTGTGTTSFEVEYGPVGFTPGSGTRVSATGNSSTMTGLAPNLCQDYYVRSACSATDSSAWIGPVALCPEVSLCDSMDQYAASLIVPQSSLFHGWYGTTAGAAAVSTTQASSGTQSVYIPADGVTDIVAWFDVIDQGTWNFTFDIFVPSGTEAYYNFQRNYTHGLGGTNAWAFDVNLLSSGTATVDGGSYGGTGIATFNYNPGQWNTIEHIIDFDNDSIYLLVNGVPASTGWTYSFSNLSVPIQCNGINFYSNPGLTNPDYYIDNLCIAPYGPSCPDPTALSAANIGCASAVLSWNSSFAATSSLIEYGVAGFKLGTGTLVSGVNSPYLLSGLTPGTSYDFYVASVCGSTDTSGFAGPVNFTTASGPLPTLNIVPTQVLVNDSMAIYELDANSTNADSIHWDFGGGVTATGEIMTDTFTVNGTVIVNVTAFNDCGDSTYTFQFDVENISLSEDALAHSLNVFPNPSSGVFNLAFELPVREEVYLQVINTLGQVVSDEYLGDINSFSGTVDLTNLPKGVYILQIQAGNAVVNRRLSLH